MFKKKQPVQPLTKALIETRFKAHLEGLVEEINNEISIIGGDISIITCQIHKLEEELTTLKKRNDEMIVSREKLLSKIDDDED